MIQMEIKIAIPDFTRYYHGCFGSYGVTDDFTFIFNAAVYNSVKLDTTVNSDLGFDNDVTGFGDIIIGGKYKLAKFGQSVVSGKLLFNLPTGIFTRWRTCGQAVEIIIRHLDWNMDTHSGLFQVILMQG